MDRRSFFRWITGALAAVVIPWRSEPPVKESEISTEVSAIGKPPRYHLTEAMMNRFLTRYENRWETVPREVLLPQEWLQDLCEALDRRMPNVFPFPPGMTALTWCYNRHMIPLQTHNRRARLSADGPNPFLMARKPNGDWGAFFWSDMQDPPVKPVTEAEMNRVWGGLLGTNHEALQRNIIQNTAARMAEAEARAFYNLT